MITIYKCETCGAEFDDWDKIVAHEEKHVNPIAYKVTSLRHIPDHAECNPEQDPRPYPLAISVPMTDGAVVKYTFDRVLQGVIGSEPEDIEAAADAG